MITFYSLEEIMKQKLGYHLSRNVPVKMLGENDSEQLHRLLGEYITHFNENKGDSFLKTVKGSGTSVVPSDVVQIMHQPSTLNFLVCLHSFGKHFHMTKPMSRVWVKKHLHNIAGGVSDNYLSNERLTNDFQTIIRSLNISQSST